MKNKIILTTLTSLILVFSFSNTAHATLNIETKVDVPEFCTINDTDGVSHNYGQAGSSNSYFAICALDVLVKNGTISSAQFSNKYPSMGLFITAINDVIADPNSQYWAIYQNGNMANLGITSLPILTGDTIILQLNDFSDNKLGDQLILHINSLILPTPTGSGGGQLNNPIITVTPTPIPIVNSTKIFFDTKKALNFLVSQQKNDGSLGDSLYTDWATLALATANYQDQTLKLIKYFNETKMTDPSLTDYERHTMALMALGLNPHDVNGINYIDKIISNFDGKQFGDASEDNDDIFALIVLQNAGYTQKDAIINSDITYILSKQNNDGSWDGSPDITGAAVEALSFFSPTPGVEESLKKAKEFLKQNQKGDGSWNGNASSTAWAIEGILGLGEKIEDWKKNDNNPLDFLATTQDIDGGTKNQNINNKIWETAYVTSALSGKTWNQTMQKFEKPKNQIVLEKIDKKLTKKQTLTATVINSNTPIPNTINKTTPEDRSWFVNLFEFIFGLK